MSLPYKHKYIPNSFGIIAGEFRSLDLAIEFYYEDEALVF